MARAESLFSFLFAVFCAIYLFLASNIDQGSMSNPGAGFMPAVLGTVGLGVSLLVFFSSLKRGKETKQAAMDTVGMKRFFSCLVSFIVFIPAFQYLGTEVSIFGLVLSVTKILGAPGWRSPLLLAVISTVTAYVVFVIILGVPLPEGIL